MPIKYVHTNIIAKDWESLADFYVKVFGCTPLNPKRDLAGEWVDRLTGIADCSIKGIHLALPGYTDGPTLEIFSYQPEDCQTAEKTLNRFGFAHIAFHVDDVEETLQKLLAHGGTAQGAPVKNTYKELGELTVIYARDPEGNLIELQNWTRP